MRKRMFMAATTACVVALAALPALAQSKPKKKGEEVKYENQKEVMKEMGLCIKEMQTLSDQLQKEKLFAAQSKLRKGISAQGERMAELSEAWKPHLKGEKAAKLADDMIASSNDLVKVSKPMGKKAVVHECVMAVRGLCGECHRGYRPKEEAGEKKDSEGK